MYCTWSQSKVNCNIFLLFSKYSLTHARGPSPAHRFLTTHLPRVIRNNLTLLGVKASLLVEPRALLVTYCLTSSLTVPLNTSRILRVTDSENVKLLGTVCRKGEFWA